MKFLCSPAVHAEERPGKAVYETSSEQGMKLTEKALKNIEVKTIKIVSNQDNPLPLDGIVRFQDQVGVYRLRRGWFKLILVQLEKRDGQQVVVRSKDLQPDDEIVIQGAGLLRVAEMDASGSGE